MVGCRAHLPRPRARCVLLASAVAVVALLLLPSPGATALAPSIPHSRSLGAAAHHVTAASLDPRIAGPSAPAAPWTVDATLSLINGTVRSGNRAYPSWFAADAVAYDSVDEKLLVETGDRIQTIDPSTMESTGSLALPGNVTAGPLAYSPTGDTLYVVTQGAVDALSAANGTLLRQYTVSEASQTGGAVVVVPSADALVVASPYRSQAAVVNLSEGLVTATLPVGAYGISQGVDDPGAGVVFLGNATGGTVEEFAVSNWTLVRTIAAGGFLSGPNGLAVSAGGDQLYLTEGGNPSYLAEVAVGNGSTIHRRALGADAGAVQFDPVTGSLFIGDGGNGSVYAVDPARLNLTATIPVPVYVPSSGSVIPLSMVEAPALGTVFVAQSFGGNRLDALSVANKTVYRSLDLYPVPTYLADDTACGCYAVGDSYSDALYFVSRTTFRLERTVELPAEPDGLAYASGTGDLWIAVGYAPFSTEEILVAYGTNGTVRATVPDPQFPVAVAYDAGTDRVFVANNNAHSVSVFNASSRRLVVNVSVGTYPLSLVDLPSAGEVFVANQGSGNVSVINATSASVRATIAVGANPSAIAYDSVAGLVVVPHLGFRTNVTPINASSDATLPGFPAAMPTGVAADTQSGLVVVANLTGTLSVWDPSTGNLTTFPLGYETYALLALPGGGFLVGDGGDGALYLVGAPSTPPLANAQFEDRPFLVENGSTVQLYVNVSAGTGPLTFRYSGLPPGCASTNSTRVRCAPSVPGTYPAYANFSDSAGNAGVLESVLWVSGGYPAWVNETGLPAGTEWWLNVSGRSSQSTIGASIYLVEPNGTYAFLATSADPHFRAVSGSFSVLGGKATTGIAFLPAGYAVTFEEAGLPYGTEWGVGLSTGATTRSVTTTASLDLPNGTFGFVPWSLDPAWGAAAGSVQVAGGAEVVSLTFAPVDFLVTFTAHGLPTGTGWYVSIPGRSTSSSTSTVLAVNLTNASYTFSARSAATGNETVNGTFTVHGAPLDLSIPFTAAAYPVTFQEQGLIASAPWWTNVTGVANLSSTTPTIVLTLANGTYRFSVGGPTGTTPSPASGGLTVAGSAVVESVGFTYPSGTAPTLVIVGFVAAPDPVNASGDTHLTVTVSGGVTPYSFSYAGLPGGCAAANASRLDCWPNGPGAFTITVTVRDPIGQVASANASLTVLPPNSPCCPIPHATAPGAISTFWTWPIVAALAGAVALALVLAGVALWRRRGRPPAAPFNGPEAPLEEAPAAGPTDRAEAGTDGGPSDGPAAPGAQ